MSAFDGVSVKEFFLIQTGALDQIKDFIIAVDNQDRLIYINKAAAKHYGVDKEQVIGLKRNSLYRQLWFNPEDEHKAFLALDQTGFWEGVNIQQQPDGSKMVVETVISVIKNEKGNKAGLLSITRDITSRVDIDQWLFETNQQLKYVVEAAGMMVYEITLKTRQITIIRGLEELLGYNAGEVPSTVDWWISQIHPDDKSKAQEQFYPTKSVEKTANEYRIRSKSGDYVFVQGIAKVLFDKSGNPQRIIGGMQNITEKKRLERQLAEKERMAAIGQTAGMVGHDIRNPLQAIVSDVYLLENYLASMPHCQAKEEAKESIESIEKNLDYINKIVADLQDFAKPLKPEPVKVDDLCKVIAQLLSTIQVPSTIEAELSCDSNLSALSLDLTFLKRILVNLATNAIEAMPKGGKLCIKVLKRAGMVQIVVQDTGIGIPEELKPKMFTPLLTTKAKGQGFGLAVVKRYTEALGGTISFESQVGKGTKFIINLPSIES